MPPGMGANNMGHQLAGSSSWSSLVNCGNINSEAHGLNIPPGYLGSSSDPATSVNNSINALHLVCSKIILFHRNQISFYNFI